jgi:hypothetical protein
MAKWTWTTANSTFDARIIGRRLTAVRNDLTHLQSTLKEVGDYILSISYRAFDKQADPTTRKPWAKLAPNTIFVKGHSRILQRTGRLRRSFKRGAEGNVFIATDRELKVGSRLRTAAIAQHGTRAHPIIARRKPMLVFRTIGGWVTTPRVRHPGTPPRPPVGINTGHLLNIAKRLKKIMRDKMIKD